MSAPDLSASVPRYVSGHLPTIAQKYGEPKDSYIGVGPPPQSGGMALGLLVGPLVMMGVGDVRSSSQAETMQEGSLMKVDLAAELTKIHPEYARPAVPDAGAHYELTPAVTLSFWDESAFSVGCFVYAQLIDQGRERWHGRYVVQGSAKYSNKSPTVGGDVEKLFDDCFTRATNLFELHIAKGASLFQEADLVGYSSIPRPVVTSLLPDRIAYFDRLGIYEVDKSVVSAVNLK